MKTALKVLCFFVFVLAVLWSGILIAETPLGVQIRKFMLSSDGINVFPHGLLATKYEVNQAANEVDGTYTMIEGIYFTNEKLRDRIIELERIAANASESGVWVLDGYLNSVGLQTGLPQYDGKMTIVDVAPIFEEGVVNKKGFQISTGIKVWCAFEPEPIAQEQIKMAYSNTLDGLDLPNIIEMCPYKTSFPEKVPNPKDPSDTRAIYTFESVDFPKLPDSGQFAKLVVARMAEGGEGSYFSVYDGVRVNGSEGRDFEMTTDDGEVLTFKGGLLVEPDSAATTEENAQ